NGESVSYEEIAGFIADVLSDLRLTVKGLKGWNEAQVTSGGVSLDEIDMNTMESNIVPGLFITGETLDYDGPCGGYNLHNAWLTGIKAGKGLAR
ncbi:MAG: NAD(P)/FAD-dependent oxidoreductase, partial [Firmicutes bacterium]|nr:NAD(P)/FAD-dependent oxidoreductase [Bacillota bacterium]